MSSIHSHDRKVIGGPTEELGGHVCQEDQPRAPECLVVIQ